LSLNGRKDSPVENVREILATWLQPHATSGASLISLITLTTVNGFAGGAVIDKHTPSHFAPWQHTHRHIHTHTNICCQEHWQLSGHHTHTGRNALILFVCFRPLLDHPPRGPGQVIWAGKMASLVEQICCVPINRLKVSRKPRRMEEPPNEQGQRLLNS